jgi:hypothetical protein
MSKPAILPGSPEHNRRISPSKIAAILNVSRWQSRFSCWHMMHDNIDRDIPDEYSNVGLAFELALAELWKFENPGWRLSSGEVQFVGEQFGFPYVATIDRRASRGRDRRAVELKTARSLEEWGDPNLDGDAPVDYVAQCVAQMLFAGPQYQELPAHLMVLGPFFRHHTYSIAYEPVVANWIVRECRAFWDSLQSGVEPELDDSVATYNCVRALHPDITPGLRVEIPEALAADWMAAHAESGVVEKTVRGLKSKVLDQVGSAQYVTVNGVVVAARQNHARGGVALVLKASR